ncbi:hypothetical protein Pint_01753 [Pistacia integerrima]|uniref:Uncharacterized protein n=1 Tax=Pistacia integerrima TaxID=434235 RepID=A0ACC0ZM18_9ROSI|nr:hypothetical protein Pint_01753 [Pistacia integerrima]
MEKLISAKCNIQSVPESYILPPETRPGIFIVPQFETIPVIDLGGETTADRTTKIQQIMKASQEYGFFQVINHGVPERLMRDELTVAKEFFELPAEDNASLYSEDPKQSCRLYTSIDCVKEKVHFWRDNLRHPCHPVEEHMQFWPAKPAQYR